MRRTVGRLRLQRRRTGEATTFGSFGYSIFARLAIDETRTDAATSIDCARNRRQRTDCRTRSAGRRRRTTVEEDEIEWETGADDALVEQDGRGDEEGGASTEEAQAGEEREWSVGARKGGGRGNGLEGRDSGEQGESEEGAGWEERHGGHERSDGAVMPTLQQLFLGRSEFESRRDVDGCSLSFRLSSSQWLAVVDWMFAQCASSPAEEMARSH